MPRIELTLARRAFLDGRVRTVAFAYLFAVYGYIEPVGYRGAYKTHAQRLAFAHSFAGNQGLRLIYGQPHNVATVAGYAAWRVGGTLAIAAAVYGLLAAVRAIRTEEDTGRVELVLSAVVGRRQLNTAIGASIAAGIAIVWVAEFAGLAVGGLPVGGAAYMALATVSVAAVCTAAAAVASQLAPNRRVALELGAAIVVVWLLLRVLADTVTGAGWLRWTTPLGWAELMRPFAGAQPLVLLLAVGATVALAVTAFRIALARDTGTGVLPGRDVADPRRYLLRGTTAQALRGQLGTLLAWLLGIAVFAYILGAASKAISPADVSKSIDKEIAKLGTGSITTPSGYLSFVFIFLILAISVFVCAQVGAARGEEADDRLETVLALPQSRRRWLGGRLVLAIATAAALSLFAGLLTWAGVSLAGAHVSLPKLLEAGANALPTAVLFLGIAALGFAVIPRAGVPIAYGLVTIAFLWQLVGSLTGAPKWLLDVTPFAHVGFVPAEPFRVVAAIVMAAIGVVLAVLAVGVFERRDLVTA